MSRRVERRFVNSDEINKHLACSICTDIFLDPTRLFCGHTYCKKCITHWNEKQKNCPICREEIEPALMGKDLIADKLILDLEVYCPNEECKWQDTLENLEKHFKVCEYTIIPDWLTKEQRYIQILSDEEEEQMNNDEVSIKYTRRNRPSSNARLIPNISALNSYNIPQIRPVFSVVNNEVSYYGTPTRRGPRRPNNWGNRNDGLDRRQTRNNSSRGQYEGNDVVTIDGNGGQSNTRERRRSRRNTQNTDNNDVNNIAVTVSDTNINEPPMRTARIRKIDNKRNNDYMMMNPSENVYKKLKNTVV